ncbi:Hypothetical predicted protein [Podarcis lilfordi]|uniref:Uncharacterized protein n=1 Tax=Podarcis lilfordi TaxID=74358 RepID=A0AA35LIK7_9SAUR|nr:Hypothetical predicted protein [Podarcis lilfordi]
MGARTHARGDTGPPGWRGPARIGIDTDNSKKLLIATVDNCYELTNNLKFTGYYLEQHR